MGLNFEAIAEMSAEEQLRQIVDLKEKNEQEHKILEGSADYAAVLELLHAGEYEEFLTAYENLASETRAKIDRLSREKKEIEALPFYLYVHSEHQEVRDAMQKTVDAFIAKHFSDRLVGVAPAPGEEDMRVTEIQNYHDLLHLSTFGGHRTESRPDVWMLAYEFNVRNGEGYQPATIWNPIETLYDIGALKVYENNTYGNNLTPIGEAILARLNERYGESKIAQNFTDPVLSPA